MSLAVLADLKTYLGISSASADAELQRMLDIASVMVEQYCERTFLTATYTVKRSGHNTDLLLLKNTPITAISALYIDGTAVAASSDGLLVPGFVFDATGEPPGVWLVGGQLFTQGRKNISITYTAGYGSGAIPMDIQHATIEIAAQTMREKDWIGYSSKTLAGETVSFLRNAFPDSAKTALDPYRRIYPCD